jgi:hypothetical protein
MSLRAPVNPRTLLTWLGLAVGIGGLVLQFVLAMQTYFAAGRDLPGALGTLFAFYTILSNCVLVVVYLSSVTATQRLKLFRHPVTRATMAASIVLVGLYVYFVLSHLHDLEGLHELADRLLHYLAPTLYVLWWISSQPHGLLRWRNLPVMLVPTLIYFVYILLRGVWVQEYPYPILDVVNLGYGQVFLNAAIMAGALAILSAIVIALDMLIARQSRTNPV